MSTLRRDNVGFRYGRPTQGWNAQGFFSPVDNQAYAVETTLQALVYADSSIAGTIGLYDMTGALVTALIADGDEFNIAQKNSDGDLKKSTVLVGGQYTVRKDIYTVPARDIKVVGYNAATASGSLNISIVGGLQEFVLSARQTNQANQPFPVQEGRAIVRSGAPTDYDIAAGIVADFNSDTDYERNGDVPFCVANVYSDVAGTLVAPGTFYTYTAKSKDIWVPGVDLTGDPGSIPGNYVQQISSKIFQKIVRVTFDGTDSVIHTDVARMVIVSAGTAQNVSASITIAAADMIFASQAEVDAMQIGIEVVATAQPIIFDLNVSEDLGDADVAQEAPGWAQGGGASWQVAYTEDECMVFDGWTTVNEAWIRDFGVPDIFVDEYSTETYAQYFIESLNRIIPSSGAPQNQTLMLSNIIVAPITGSDLETQLDVIFGV